MKLTQPAMYGEKRKKITQAIGFDVPPVVNFHNKKR